MDPGKPFRRNDGYPLPAIYTHVMPYLDIIPCTYSTDVFASASSVYIPFTSSISAFALRTYPDSQLLMNLSFPDLSSASLRVLIDSGSSRSFIDSRLVSDQGIPTTRLPHQLTLRLFDGSIAPSGKISDYVRTQFQLPLFPLETWNFLVTPLDASCDLVLGLDWLKA